ncbi:MAG: hypothetical protein WBO16_13140 [Gammaproteobacteria bacterium]|jgi:hypothetical protein
MQKNTLRIFDFDVAMELARTDSEAFERYRQHAPVTDAAGCCPVSWLELA